ncbi:RICIN domain-containing protein [Streptacidiphilus sp. 4-A2]|nr:RICIN domain-containing protein [Streptacidiphilus sp. 4-A2]
MGLSTSSFSFDNAVGLPAGPVRSGSPDICLVRPDAGRAVTTPGTTPVTGPCGGQGSTSWTLSNAGAVQAQGLCLGWSGGTGVTLAGCTGAAGQRWSAGAGQRLVNAETGNCLDTVDGTLAVGVPVRLRSCGSWASQRWVLPYNGRR